MDDVVPTKGVGGVVEPEVGGVEDRGLRNIHLMSSLTNSSKLSWLGAMTSGIPQRAGSRPSKLAVGLDPLEEADVATSVPPEKGV